MTLRLDSVTKRYGRQTALDRVSLHVRPGDCYGFLGHNGAGKTTSMRIALGLVRPDAGRVVVDGFDAARYPREARARLGGLIETPGFYDHVSGRRNLVLLARLQGLDRSAARRESDRLLDAVGLSSARDKRVGAYSQGMRQRLGIAQALLGDPLCVLLDEPMSGLDPEGVHEIRELLHRLTRDEGRTVLLSSHQISEVAGLCTRIGILRDGVLLVEAEPDVLLAPLQGRYRARTGDDDRAARVLASLDLACEPASDGGIEFAVASENAGGVARALVEAGLDLHAFGPRPVSLEEIYLRTTRGEGSRVESTSAPAPLHCPDKTRAPAWPVLRVLRHEISRWTSGPAVAVAFSVPAILAVLAVVRRWAASEDLLRQVDEGSSFSESLVTGFEGLTVGLRAGLPAAALVVAGLASQAIAGENSRGTLRNLLLRPLGRPRLLLGKALGALGAGVVAYLSVAVAAALAAAWAFDYTDVVEILAIDNVEPFTLVAADELRPVMWRMLACLAAPMAAYGALGLLAGAVARSGAAALALALGSVVGLDLLRAVGRETGFEGALLSSYAPSPLGDTSYAMHFLNLIHAPNSPPVGFVDGAVWVPLVWATACVALAAVALGRRSVR